MSQDEKYRERVTAASLSAPDGTIFSHQSAAAIWRLPSVVAWPRKAHILTPRADGGRSTQMLQRHTSGIPAEFAVIDDVRVTTLARTVADLAAKLPFAHAVAMADAALRRHHPAAAPGEAVRGERKVVDR